MSDEIKIIDVIHHYNAYGMQIMVVVDRMPEYRYERVGNNLTAHDSGFWDFMFIEAPTKHFQAFAGREFDIQLADGSTMHCKGQVWSGRQSGPTPEPLVSVGVNTIEGLTKCHVFMSCGGISKAKYEAWLAENTPSYRLDKYDPRASMAFWDEIYRNNPDWDHPVCAQRARKLRKRGITIRRHPVTGKPGWSASYERHKADENLWADPNYRGRHYKAAMGKEAGK